MNALERRAKEAKEAEEELELDRQHHWFSKDTRWFFCTVMVLLGLVTLVTVGYLADALILKWFMQRLP